VPSGMTAVLVATAPFWLVGIEAIWSDGEPITLRRALGLVAGFSGIVLLVWPEIDVSGSFLKGVIASQLACIGWSIGSAYARRRHHSENVLMTAAAEMLLGGIALLTVGLMLGEWRALAFSQRSAGALAYLIVFGSIIGFSAYAYALKHLPVAFVSQYAYVNPIIAVVLGTLILHEPFNARVGVAAGIVLFGMALVRARP
jgi:drug/metabolite transporter (DMT)-like permease